MPRAKTRCLQVRGACVHNLKNIDVDIPHDQLTVITGPSGSGKSSLAFDTLYAEGQRRFVESMSTYARQFIRQMARPEVASMDHILPAIALEQKNGVRNARSTVGTATEIQDYLALIFAHAGQACCPDCDVAAQAHAPESAARALAAETPAGARLVIVAPTALPPARNAEVAEALRRDFMKDGWSRFWHGGAALGLEDLDASHLEGQDALRIVTDRIVVGADGDSDLRLASALEAAFAMSGGQAEAWTPDDGDQRRFSSALSCPQCQRTVEPLRPAMFSFYSPMGACPDCQGFGRVMGIDMDKVVPNPDLSLAQGAIHPWNTPSNRAMVDWFREVLDDTPFPWDTPVGQLEAPHRDWLFEGYGEFWGVAGFFAYLEKKKYKIQNRVMLARYRSYVPCPTCGGMRLKPEGRSARLAGHRLFDLLNLSIRDLAPEIAAIEKRLASRQRESVALAMRELKHRLDYLNTVGLGYLTLIRQTRTLSGGEAQRINLATALGSALTGALYVLDEPTVGLHPRDTQALLEVLRRLRDQGNTVVVVEHDPLIMGGADHLIDMGPAAGDRGGQIIYAGSLRGLTRRADSPTGRYLAQVGRQTPPPPLTVQEGSDAAPADLDAPQGWITVRGAREHNLQHLDVAFPLGVFCCLTGVSGSGKTSLMRDVLYGGYARRRGDATVDAGACDALEGMDQIGDMALIDQSPLTRSARSNPVTYVKAWDPIRRIFAAAAATQGKKRMTPSHFSFNSPKGRCPACKGVGVTQVDMHFLADLEMVCEQCNGGRFKPRVLEVTYAGRTIVDVLDMTVDRAATFFADYPAVLRALAPLRDVGLGYLRLGQRASTLSGGEAQRLKMAGVLATRSRGKRTLLLFDEPTTGLHPSDIDILLQAMGRLIASEAGVMVIEHNLDCIARADYVIDLGPEGGDQGGRLVYAGPLAGFMEHKTSHTAAHLRRHLSATNGHRKS